MKGNSLFLATAACAMVLGLSAGARAQSDSQKPAQQHSAKKPVAPKRRRPAQVTPAAEKHKVWTEDDMAGMRTPADHYIDMEAARSTANVPAANQVNTAKGTTATNSGKPAGPAPLAVAKSAGDADAKIAWEERDIQGQRETIDQLQQQLASAPPEQREHLQDLIKQHNQYIVECQKEIQGLQQQKKDLKQ